MEPKLITLKSANKIDTEGQAGIEIIVNTAHITHFHKAEQREGNLTHVHFTGGQVALVTQTVEEVRDLIEPPQKETQPQNNLDKFFR